MLGHVRFSVSEFIAALVIAACDEINLANVLVNSRKIVAKTKIIYGGVDYTPPGNNHGKPNMNEPNTTGGNGEAVATGIGLGAVVDFITAKLAEAEKALRCRKEAETCWRGGTDASWRAVGCRLTKAQRLKNADAEGRISIRCQREVDLFKATLSVMRNIAGS